jgi:hypothetical protein
MRLYFLLQPGIRHVVAVVLDGVREEEEEEPEDGELKPEMEVEVGGVVDVTAVGSAGEVEPYWGQSYM